MNVWVMVGVGEGAAVWVEVGSGEAVAGARGVEVVNRVVGDGRGDLSVAPGQRRVTGWNVGGSGRVVPGRGR